MNEKEFNNFVAAVDVVCGVCVKCSEETCANCPVRESVTYHNKNLKK